MWSRLVVESKLIFNVIYWRSLFSRYIRLRSGAPWMLSGRSSATTRLDHVPTSRIVADCDFGIYLIFSLGGIRRGHQSTRRNNNMLRNGDSADGTSVNLMLRLLVRCLRFCVNVLGIALKKNSKFSKLFSYLREVGFFVVEVGALNCLVFVERPWLTPRLKYGLTTAVLSDSKSLSLLSNRGGSAVACGFFEKFA